MQLPFAPSRSAAGERPRAAIDKQLHPDFQRQQLPDLHRPVFRAPPVLVNIPANCFRTKQPSALDLGF